MQRKLAGQIEAEGAPNSAARREAAGKAATDTQIQCEGAKGQLEKQLTNAGAAPGSGRANLAITGLGSDVAKSKGLSTTISDQQIEWGVLPQIGAAVAFKKLYHAVPSLVRAGSRRRPASTRFRRARGAL